MVRHVALPSLLRVAGAAFAFALAAGAQKPEPQARAAGDTSALPPRTSTPRPTLGGVWRGSGRVLDSRGALRGHSRVLLALAGPSGFMVESLFTNRDSLFKVSVFRVGNARTTTSGEIGFSMPGVVDDGYQTTEGFVSTQQGDGYTCTTVYAPALSKLSENSGLYGFEASTQAYDDRQAVIPGTVANWSGTGVIISTRDSIFVVVDLPNSAGGGAQYRLEGRQNADGTFSLKSADGMDALMGTIRRGVVAAEWVRRIRSDLYFRGPLQGLRH